MGSPDCNSSPMRDITDTRLNAVCLYGAQMPQPGSADYPGAQTGSIDKCSGIAIVRRKASGFTGEAGFARRISRLFSINRQ